jgi:TRAP-type mannitol/chloroaromatic compound transport system permease large subunit
MSDPALALVMLGLFIFLILLGFPIAFTLMGMGVAFGYYAYYQPGTEFFDNRVFYLLTQNTWSILSNDVLVAVPLFLFMGYVIERSNILDRLFYSLQVAMRHVPGSMAVATLLTCAMFATATGIVGAVVTLMGLLALPAMLKAGYDQRLSCGVICAGGTLGILIPPSIMLIVYAAAASVSVVRLYAAAMLPGLLLAGLYVLYVLITRVVMNPEAGAGAPEGGERRAVEQGGPAAPGGLRAARRADFLCTRFDSVRSGDADRGRRGRRVGEPHPGGLVPGAYLVAPAGGGLPHGAHLGDGVLPVRGIVAVLLGVLVSRR